MSTENKARDAKNEPTTTKRGASKSVSRSALALCAPLLGLAVLAPAVAPAQAAPPPPPAATATPTADVGPLITVDDLKVWKGEEQDWNQNGDEPVVVTLMIRTTLGEKNSTRTAWVSSQPRELGSGVDNGDWVSVPDDQGDAHFVSRKRAIEGGDMSVHYLSADELIDAIAAGKQVRPDVAMTVSFAFDGDFSGQKALMDFMNTLRTTMVKKVTPIFEAAQISGDPKQMGQSVADVQKAAKKATVSVWDVLLNIDSIWSYVWKSGGDYDDLIGVSAMSFIPVEKGVTDVLPIEPEAAGLDKNWTKDTTPRVSVGNGWIDVPVRFGLLEAGTDGTSVTKVVQSDLPIEDHVGYDLRHWIKAAQ